jgi:sugar O-acyltransferase (sialic acid O-acetyltransferase NeuD family)
MKYSEVVLLGGGGHSRACIDVFESQNKYQIGGLVDNRLGLKGGLLGYSCLGTDDDLPSIATQYELAFVAVGHVKISELRRSLFHRLLQLGFKFPTVVAPTAYVSPHARIGAGSIVMHGAIVNAGAIIGDNCIVNSRALVEHDAKVADHCHISTGAILNGDVSVGEGSFIGSGSTVREGLAIGRNVLVGMASSVRHSLADGVRFVGNGKS